MSASPPNPFAPPGHQENSSGADRKHLVRELLLTLLRWLLIPLALYLSVLIALGVAGIAATILGENTRDGLAISGPLGAGLGACLWVGCGSYLAPVQTRWLPWIFWALGASVVAAIGVGARALPGFTTLYSSLAAAFAAGALTAFLLWRRRSQETHS